MAAGFRHEGDRLSAFLDDELDDEAALHVTRHLEHCAACRDELEQLRSMRAALRSLPPVAPRLSWMVETAVLVPTGTQPRSSATAAVALVAAAGLVLSGAFLLGGDPGTVEPVVDELVMDHVRAVEGGPVVTPVQLDGGTEP